MRNWPEIVVFIHHLQTHLHTHLRHSYYYRTIMSFRGGRGGGRSGGFGGRGGGGRSFGGRGGRGGRGMRDEGPPDVVVGTSFFITP